MAELVEERLRLVQRQQAGLPFRRLGEVHDVVDHRGRTLAKPVARLERAHPGARALRGAREIVGHEQAAIAAVGVPDLENAHVGMPGWDALLLHEG
jgi:hypothetical protein